MQHIYHHYIALRHVSEPGDAMINNKFLRLFSGGVQLYRATI